MTELDQHPVRKPKKASVSTRYNFWILNRQLNELLALSEETGFSVSELLRKAVEDLLEAKKAKQGGQ
jgi:hypothetical protein